MFGSTVTPEKNGGLEGAEANRNRGQEPGIRLAWERLFVEIMTVGNAKGPPWMRAEGWLRIACLAQFPVVVVQC
jgi:hypothetical protein